MHLRMFGNAYSDVAIYTWYLWLVRARRSSAARLRTDVRGTVGGILSVVIWAPAYGRGCPKYT